MAGNCHEGEICNQPGKTAEDRGSEKSEGWRKSRGGHEPSSGDRQGPWAGLADVEDFLE